jgi:SAM-dependent methyltransferase
MINTYLERTYQQMGEKLIVDETYFERDSRFYNLEKILRSLPPGRFLDMGCGQGSVLNQLKDYHKPFGLEYDDGARSVAKNRGIPCEGIDLNVASDLPFEGEFDYILISEVCEHLLDPRNAFALAHKYLKKGGIFIVTVPNSIPLRVRLRLILGLTSDWIHYPSGDTEQTGHIRFYTFTSLRRLAEQQGFHFIKSRGVSWRFNGPIWGRAFFWVARFFGSRDGIHKRVMRLDDLFSKIFSGLSPGILMILKKE